MGNRRDHSCSDTRGLGCLRMSVVLGQKNGRSESQSPYCCLTLEPNCHYSVNVS